MCETIVAVFIFNVPFIRWVNICFLLVYMRKVLGEIRNNQSIIQKSYKVSVLAQNFLQLHI